MCATRAQTKLERERFEKDSFHLSIFHCSTLSRFECLPVRPTPAAPAPSSANFMCVRAIHFEIKKVARAICVSKANRDEHNKSLVAQNFLVFEAHVVKSVGVGGCVDVVLCSRDVRLEPENSPLGGALCAPKWSLGHKTYIEKTLLGINVNNCNILCLVVRIASSSGRLCHFSRQFFMPLHPLLRKPACTPSPQLDPMINLDSRPPPSGRFSGWAVTTAVGIS